MVTVAVTVTVTAAVIIAVTATVWLEMGVAWSCTAQHTPPRALAPVQLHHLPLDLAHQQVELVVVVGVFIVRQLVVEHFFDGQQFSESLQVIGAESEKDFCPLFSFSPNMHTSETPTYPFNNAKLMKYNNHTYILLQKVQQSKERFIVMWGVAYLWIHFA
jgi:hypothetical protein